MPVIDETWLCELWKVPPELACNGDGPRMAVLRYAGEMESSRESRILRCGDVSYECTDSPVVQLWIPAPDSELSPGQWFWKIVPIRVLAPDRVETFA